MFMARAAQHPWVEMLDRTAIIPYKLINNTDQIEVMQARVEANAKAALLRKTANLKQTL